MRNHLNNLTVERRGDEVILREDDHILSEMTAEYALEVADQIVSQADKILAAVGGE